MLLIFDENMPWEIADLLTRKGFDTFLIPKKTKDTEIARITQERNGVIITQDKDFTNKLLFPPERFSGIIHIRIHPPIIADIQNALENLFHNLSSENLKGKLVLLAKDGFRVI